MVTGLADVSSFDVVVVGSGPGGSATAIWCAQKGLQVALIEAKPFPRSHPGETLHPGIEPLLEQLGAAESVLAANFVRHSGNWVQWDAELQFIPFGEDESGAWLGFQAWRADFDSILLERAKAVGVTVMQPCRAIQVLVEEGRVVGVETSQGILRASKVVDASGNHHLLARQLGLKIHQHSPRLIAYYGYVTGECPKRDGSPAIVADSDGWTWTARVRSGFYQWTRLSLVGEKVKKDWLPEEFHGLKIHKRMHAAEVTWRIVSQPAGLGYFIVGDAAAVLDPASSHGVLKAIMSGMWAGHLITAQLLDNLSEIHAIREYCQWLDNWFRHDVDKLSTMYDKLPR
ncbi:NAD(P)/FAD-dependent oxidoreductase [Scytonema sp. NUACC26]|uniref:NAD(P)/FAD-dependent oxidoreductase n=1 Tax=Scytonema sp. NUACC26 TaxID=3140176 RepID=UPI0034DB7E5F